MRVKAEYYDGRPCKFGHTLRYRNSRACVTCIIETGQAYYKLHKDLSRKSARKHKGIPEPTREMSTSCELCGGATNGQGVFHADHDKVTNKFRGWLCSRCNMGLGLLGDNIEGLKKALFYLEKSI